MSEVILAICFGGGKIGAAYYEEDIKTVRLLHDVTEEGDFSVVVSLLEQVNPSQVLVCAAQDVALLAFLNQICEPGGGDSTESSQLSEEETDGPVIEDISARACEQEAEVEQVEKFVPHGAEEDRSSSENDAETRAPQPQEHETNDDEYENPKMRLHLLPKTEFRTEHAQTRIQLLFAEESRTPAERKLVTSFRVEMTNLNMVRAFGALLKFMDRNRIGVEYEHVDVKTPVSAIKVFTIEEMLDIDGTTFSALQIFHSDYHPSVGKRAFAGRASAKEGLSLFRICNHCRSNPGKKLLRRWFERPTTNRNVLTMRQKAISYFIQDCNMEVTQFLYTKLKNVKSLKGVLVRIQGGTVSTHDWKNLYLTCSNMVQISEFLKGRQVRLEILEELLPFCNQELVSTTAILSEIIDFDASAREGRFIVAMGVDAELDRLKNIHENLPEILTQIALEECRTMGITSCSVGYIPVIGFLLTVPIDVQVQEGAELEMVYCTDEVANYKSPRMRELDSEIGDIKPLIMDMERTIMLRVQSSINKRCGVILRAVHVMAVIDALLSLTIAAREFRWNRPQLVDEAIIDVDGARHPISEMMSEKPFVPNPIKSGGRASKVKLLTGPNASGKSVYLKQIGLIAYMTHIGSFVPADRAVIGPVNRILTRMYTVDKVLDGMSTFAKDLNQMSVALRRSNGFSLVIIDEFGKGTMTEVGLSIFACTLNYWLAKGNQSCPHVYASSHFHALPKLLEYSDDMLTYHTLEVLKHGEHLEFLYRLVDGLIDCSYASYTAGQVGLDREIVNRADQIYQVLRSGKTLEQVMPCNYDEHEENGVIASQMESLLPDFLSWNLDDDPEGFIQRAMSVLVGAQDDDDVPSVEAPPETSNPLQLHGTLLQPHSSPLQLHSSQLQLHSSPLQLHSSQLQLHTSPLQLQLHNTPLQLHISPFQLHSNRTGDGEVVSSVAPSQSVSELFRTPFSFSATAASSIGSPDYSVDFCANDSQRTLEGFNIASLHSSRSTDAKESNNNFGNDEEVVPETQMQEDEDVVPETPIYN